jgi:hypothetical protein
MKRMAIWCIRFNQSPETFYSLTVGEIAAFWSAIEPETDLTGLY